MYPYLNQGKWVSLLVNSQQKLNSMVVACRAEDKQIKKNNSYDKYKQKSQMKPLRIQFRKWNNRISKIYCNQITRRNFFSQIVSFLIEKIISSQTNPRTVKKIRSTNLLVEVINKKEAKKLIKWKPSTIQSAKFTHMKK